MSTIDNKEFVDKLIAGEYPENGIVKIVKYTNAWGNVTYGCMFEGDSPNMYDASDFVINPEVYWSKE